MESSQCVLFMCVFAYGIATIILGIQANTCLFQFFFRSFHFILFNEAFHETRISRCFWYKTCLRRICFMWSEERQWFFRYIYSVILLYTSLMIRNRNERVQLFFVCVLEIKVEWTELNRNCWKENRPFYSR